VTSLFIHQVLKTYKQDVGENSIASSKNATSSTILQTGAALFKCWQFTSPREKQVLQPSLAENCPTTSSTPRSQFRAPSNPSILAFEASS